METEIIDNLKDKIDVNTIRKILDESKILDNKVKTDESAYGINMV